MDPIKIKLLNYYLSTLEYPPEITSVQKAYISSQSKYYGLENDILYRKSKNGPKRVLNKQEADNAIFMYHHHPLGGHFASKNTYEKTT